jgi:hypothetical protein
MALNNHSESASQVIGSLGRIYPVEKILYFLIAYTVPTERCETTPLQLSDNFSREQFLLIIAISKSRKVEDWQVHPVNLF